VFGPVGHDPGVARFQSNRLALNEEFGSARQDVPDRLVFASTRGFCRPGRLVSPETRRHERPRPGRSVPFAPEAKMPTSPWSQWCRSRQILLSMIGSAVVRSELRREVCNSHAGEILTHKINWVQRLRKTQCYALSVTVVEFCRSLATSSPVVNAVAWGKSIVARGLLPRLSHSRRRANAIIPRPATPNPSFLH
jgi:hypothetical protein